MDQIWKRPHKHISFSMRPCSWCMWSYQGVVGFSLSVSGDECLYILSLAWEAGWYACNPWYVKVLPSFWSSVLHSWHQTGLDMTWFWYHVQSPTLKQRSYIFTNTHISLYAATKFATCPGYLRCHIEIQTYICYFMLLLPRVEVYLNATLFHPRKDRPVFFRLLDFFCNSREKLGMLPGGTTSHEGEATTKFNFEWRQTSSMFGVFLLDNKWSKFTNIVPTWWFNGDVLHLQLLWKLNMYICILCIN